MSRLQSLNIPFAAGHTDEVDEKLLPTGVFAEVNNGRLPAVGALRLRRGWRPLTMVDLEFGTTISAIDLHSYGPSLVAVGDGFRLSTLTESNASRPWVLNADSRLPTVTSVRVVGNIPELSSHVLRASAAVTADGVYGCVLHQTATESVFRVFEIATDQTIAYAALPNGSRVRKVVSMGTTFGLVENTGAALTLYALNPVGVAPTFALVATLVTAAVDWFDVAVATDSTPTALHLAYVSATATQYAQYTFAGVQVGATKLLSGATTTEAVTLCCVDDVTVHAVWQDTGEDIHLITFSATSPFATIAGPTAVNAGQDVVIGQFCVIDIGTIILVASERLTGAGLQDEQICDINAISPETTHAVNERYVQNNTRLFGGWLSRSGLYGVGTTRGDISFTATAVEAQTHTSQYQNLNQPLVYLDFGISAQPIAAQEQPPFWPGLAPNGVALVLSPLDRTPGQATTPRTAISRTFRWCTTERRSSAELAGALYISGGVLSQWTTGLSDVGMGAPVIMTLTPSNSTGTIGLGTYSYRAIIHWTDERGREHRSDVSLAKDSTLAGANDTNTIVLSAPKTLRRSGNLITNPIFELFRTEAGPGELFYLVGSVTIPTYTDTATIVDTMPDATLIAQPQLYTQGEVGATSGILAMCPPRPATFVAATKRRLILGGSDTGYQWSQVQFPETQVWFAEPGLVGDAAQAYLDDVEGGSAGITGVAALDEVAFIGTAERIYVTGGTGPNLAGTGEFSPPTRLPTDVGFYNALSLLETSEGLWFLGSLNTFYLLARGTPTPELSRAVQDRLTTAVMGCGYDQRDNAAVWATAGATAIVRQLDSKQWFGDSLPFTPIALHGHQGQLYAIASNGVVWRQDATAYGDGASGATAVALRVATGQIGPFEMAGWGRLAVVEVLGEFQAAAAILAEISYDDGLTWTSLGTHTVTGLAVGAAWQRQYYPARQRGDRFRVRCTMTPSVTTTEGCRLTGCTVYYSKRSGQTRLDSAKRR